MSGLAQANERYPRPAWGRRHQLPAEQKGFCADGDQRGAPILLSTVGGVSLRICGRNVSSYTTASGAVPAWAQLATSTIAQEIRYKSLKVTAMHFAAVASLVLPTA